MLITHDIFFPFFFFESLEVSFNVKSLESSTLPQFRFFRKLCRPNRTRGRIVCDL